MLADGSEVWDIIKEDPTRGIRVANIKYLLNDISAEMITWFFGGDWFRSPRPDTGVPADEEKDKILEELGEKLDAKFEEEYPDYDHSADVQRRDAPRALWRRRPLHQHARGDLRADSGALAAFINRGALGA
ncbi:MAG: hypothetical protein E2P01_06520 [Acidobacteria bacterium]|nr:MAG: hypothetical protein E2P01_06520 [Acidobacteriota bacterium]